MATPTKSIRVPVEQYEILLRHAAKTKRTLQYLISRAIERYCGNEKAA
jgi:predicted DNA-binding protein